ncbi:hypothetical protein IFM89_022583 [Coptis chinensis]|uniref:Nicalin n=1 Tax=Coptis chinensis TaxID=261450 RepID=A0A835HGD6_9MAGN|nr:hypothetical protein IFM89_022583 [Coptis chinensis]
MAINKGREMIETILALFIILIACVELCDAATVVDVYRLIQYDLSGVPFGSRFSRLNHHASYSYPLLSSTDLSRSVLIIPLRELNITFLRECITQKRAFGGILLLLPQEFSSESKDDSKEDGQMYGNDRMRSILAELEQLLIHANLPYPVYFAFEDEKIDAILTDVKRKDAVGQSPTATTGGYKLVAAVPEPKKIASAAITNIQGWLPGLRTDGDANQLPTIAIVASYDTFGAAPALSVGSDSNGSGVVALLEIARLFSRLYSNPKTRGRYNLLFGLTSGGPYNYNGTMKWLRSLDQRVRESIDYAVCLNSVGSWNDELWIHVSKPPENAYIKQVFESFSSVAEELGVKVSLKHKKINISNPRKILSYPILRIHVEFGYPVTPPERIHVAWEHEQFSRVRVTALTLSGLSVAPGLLESTGGLLDSRKFVDQKAIHRSVKLVAESLGVILYSNPDMLPNIELIADSI